MNNKQIKQRSIKPKGLIFILFILQKNKIEYTTEHKFSKDRKFRFDIAIPKHKIAIEYEGIYATKSRHTTTKGYTSDTEKYNLAITEGWKLLRYTASNFKDFETDIHKLIHSTNESKA